MIEISGLTKQFGRNQAPAVKDLTIEINDGEIMGFAGLNGAGKTTTIRVISGIIFPTSGRVMVDNKDIVKEKVNASKNIGWVPELPNFEPNGKSIALMKYYAGFYGIGPKEAEEKAEQLLKQFSIWGARTKKLKDYSQGMKKRFSIAASLIADPQNFLFDETLNGLDPEGVRNLRNFMEDLKKQGKAVFLSSHILSELERIADRIAIIKDGVLVRIVDGNDLPNLGATFVKVKLQNGNEEAESILGKYGNVEMDGHTYLVRNLSIKEDETYKINEDLVKSGFRVQNFNAEGEGLEDYFLDLVGDQN